MPRSLRRGWLARAAIVACALAVGASLRPAQTPRLAATTARPPSPLHRASELPAALQASLSGEAVSFVSVIAADIDFDGDLDVIGSDDHLSLVVLVNDGHGHLSRTIAKRPTHWQTEPDPPTLQDRADGRLASIQNDAPSMAVHAAPASFAAVLQAAVPLTRAPALAAAPVSSSVPRAPPAAPRA